MYLGLEVKDIYLLCDAGIEFKTFKEFTFAEFAKVIQHRHFKCTCMCIGVCFCLCKHTCQYIFLTCFYLLLRLLSK